MENKDYGFDTLALRAGYTPGPEHSATPPLFMTNAYTFDSTEHARSLFALEQEGNIYTRIQNPTNDILEKRMAMLEGGIGALAFASGHAAIFGTMMTLVAQGDEVVASSRIYGGAVSLLGNTMAGMGITTHFVNPDDPANFEAAITDKTKVIFLEVIGNPTANFVDLQAVGEIGRRHGIPVVADCTFTPPCLLRALEHGADIVVHSSTKYVCGHGAGMGGLVVDGGRFKWKDNPRFPAFNLPDPGYHGMIFADTPDNAGFITRLRVCTMRDLGACASPFNSWLMLIGLETLSLRMERHCANALAVAQFLEAHPAVEKVYYPGLKSSPYYKLAQKLLPKGCGGILSFDIKGGREAGAKFINKLQLWINLANVGDARSLVIHPATTTHSQLSDEQLASAGIGPGTIRLSAGLENIDDLINDLKQALN